MLRIHEYPTPQAVADAVCQRILQAAHAAIAVRGRFVLALAGGATPRMAYAQLAQVQNVAWDRWWIFYGDERCLPATHPERNSVMAETAWLAQVPIPRPQIYTIPAELGAEAAARAYANRLILPFDGVLLGMGEDGHTASLFPGHCHDPMAAVHAVHGAPKPPPQRVSLSATTLAQTRDLWVMATGASKAEALQRWRAGEDLPIAKIQPPNGVDVLADAAALAGVLSVNVG